MEREGVWGINWGALPLPPTEVLGAAAEEDVEEGGSPRSWWWRTYALVRRVTSTAGRAQAAENLAVHPAKRLTTVDSRRFKPLRATCTPVMYLLPHCCQRWRRWAGRVAAGGGRGVALSIPSPFNNAGKVERGENAVGGKGGGAMRRVASSTLTRL